MDNIQTAFNTKMPPKSVLLQGEGARSGGELGAGKRCQGVCEVGAKGTSLPIPERRYASAPVVPAGSSPHPSLTEEEDSQTELLIAEEKLSPEQEGQLMPR